MGKSVSDVNNTTIKVLIDYMNAAAKAVNEQIIRTESYMVESQSSGIASGWVSEDGEHVVKNLRTTLGAFDASVKAMIDFALASKNMQVDGDQIGINGYVDNGVSPDTT